ncbi:hypothetical protein CDEF62S_00599 [Castellaniella defragrans]
MTGVCTPFVWRSDYLTTLCCRFCRGTSQGTSSATETVISVAGGVKQRAYPACTVALSVAWRTSPSRGLSWLLAKGYACWGFVRVRLAAGRPGVVNAW